jgi:hypothetical protein
VLGTAYEYCQYTGRGVEVCREDHKECGIEDIAEYIVQNSVNAVFAEEVRLEYRQAVNR